jgi:hypothetical protein
VKKKKRLGRRSPSICLHEIWARKNSSKQKKKEKKIKEKKENSSQVSDHNLFPIFIFDFLSLFIFSVSLVIFHIF